MIAALPEEPQEMGAVRTVQKIPFECIGYFFVAREVANNYSREAAAGI